MLTCNHCVILLYSFQKTQPVQDLMSDGVVMQKVKEGDLSQAALLFQKYHRKIYHYLGKMSGDYHLAEDLTQNVFIKMIQYKNTFNPEMNFESWIFRIARNSFLDHTQQKKNVVYTDMEPYQHLSDTDEQEQPEQEERLHQALANIPADDREILVLTRFQKLKYHEAAAILGITETHVKVKVFRAIEKLRTSFFQLESK